MFSFPMVVLCGLTLTSCSGIANVIPGGAPVPGVELHGGVHGGQQPVSGSTIQLYAVGSTGDGSSAAALLTSAVVTDQAGGFTITGHYVCPSASALVYVVATGGNPGIGVTNQSLALMTALGACGNLTPGTFISVNELTTVASVFPLAPFMNSLSQVGYGGDPSALGSAFAEVNELVNTSTGMIGGTALPGGEGLPVEQINSLADIIAGCINSAGGVSGDGSFCGQLFTLTGGVTTIDVVKSLLQIAKHPTTNLTQLYNLIAPNSPFQPTLVGAPTIWKVDPAPQTTAPFISPAGGNYNTAQSVTLSETQTGATVYYTADGSTPTLSSSQYTGPIYVASTTTIKAFAMAAGYADSPLVAATYTIPPMAATPVISPAGGTFSTPQSITLSDSSAGAYIYYTTDGSTPGTSSTLYGAPFTISNSATVKAVALGGGYANSAYASATFVINPSAGGISTVAGSGVFGAGTGDGGSALNASLRTPKGVAVDQQGNFYIAETDRALVRKVTPAGVISTVAGIPGSTGYSGDGGPATSAALYGPVALALDGRGNLFIADGNRIREVFAANGIITTVAGTGQQLVFSGDGGPATAAAISQPQGIAVDGQFNLYIADYDNNRIRKVTAAGIISTFAGNGGRDLSPTSGSASTLHITAPEGVAVDVNGNVFVADNGYCACVRKITPAGSYTTIAGNGTNGFSGDGGPGSMAALNNPIGVALDGNGSVYIADNSAYRVRVVNAAGIISTVAGNGQAVASGDGGPATSAAVIPWGITVDNAGDLFIADNQNDTIRKVTAGQ